MNRTNVHNANARRTLSLRRSFALTSVLVPVLLGAFAGCSSGSQDGEPLEQSRQALTAADCGYAVAAEVYGVSSAGFHAKVTVTNVAGPAGQSFAVFVDAGGAVIADVARGTAEVVEGGYLLRPIGAVAESELDRGESFSFQLKLDGPYSQLQAYIVGANDVSCDREAPSVTLSASDDFFTADGTLYLVATATDNVAVQKVSFARDGVVIGEDSTAPYTLAVPITAALDGRHRFTATARDVSGNTASETERVLVAIGSQFFGTAVSGSADYPRLREFFDQVTPENAGKWGVVEATRDQMNWAELDAAYAFSEQHGLPFKFHTLIWGNQQPGWLSGLSPAEQLVQIEEWMTAVAARYPNVALIDVVNEPLNAPPSYAAALGGAGATGYDWVITAFEMARGHFPNAELILNEYNTLLVPGFASRYVEIVNALRERGLIDGIGEQGHFLERAELPTVAANLDVLAATGLPIYVSELDVNFADDARHAQRVSALFPIFWQHPSVVGVTHWGYRQGAMWRPDAYLLRSDGSKRPALTWLECYLGGGTTCSVPPYVPAPRTGSAGGIVLEAEDYDAAQGVIALGNVVAYTDNGDWLSYEKVAFQSAWTTLGVTYMKGSAEAASLSIHLDALSNAPVATVALPSTGGWGTSSTVSIPWAPISGERNVFVRFNGGFGVANLDSLSFSAPASAGTNIVSNGTFETGTSGWFSWNGGTLSQSARAHSGSSSLLVTNRENNAPAATDLTSRVRAGASYPVSVWVSIDSTDGSSKAINLTRKLTCSNQSASYAWVGNQVTVPDDGGWVQISGTLAIPDCTVTELQLYVEGGAGADLYVDDVEVMDSGPENLLPDGTFETGLGAWYGWNNTSLAVTTAAAHSGLQSLASVNRTANGALARTVTSLVAPGKRYQSGFWVSVSDIAAGSASVNVTKKVTCNGSTSYTWLGQSVVTNGQWAQIAGSVDLSSCATVEEVTLYAEGPSSGSLYVDDVMLSLQP